MHFFGIDNFVFYVSYKNGEGSCNCRVWFFISFAFHRLLDCTKQKSRKNNNSWSPTCVDNKTQGIWIPRIFLGTSPLVNLTWTLLLHTLQRWIECKCGRPIFTGFGSLHWILTQISLNTYSLSMISVFSIHFDRSNFSSEEKGL